MVDFWESPVGNIAKRDLAQFWEHITIMHQDLSALFQTSGHVNLISNETLVTRLV